MKKKTAAEPGTSGPVAMKEIVDAYDRWRAEGTTASRDAYYALLEKSLTRLMYADIWKNCRKAYVEVDDLLQSAREVIVRKMEDYDPRMTKPGTYFLRYIYEAWSSLGRPLSKHYQTQKAKINKRLRDAGYDGMSDPRLTEAQISAITGVQLVTVHETCAQERMTANVGGYEANICSMNIVSEGSVEDTVEDPYNANPEIIVLQKERRDAGFRAFDTELNALEKKIVYEHAAELKPFKAISVELKTGWADFGLLRAPSPTDVSKIFSVGRRKLEASPDIRFLEHINNDEVRNERELFEQAHPEDIFSQMDDLDDSQKFDDI